MIRKPFSDCARYFREYLYYLEKKSAQPLLSTSSPIKRMTLVGAKTHSDNNDMLSDNDRLHVRRTFYEMAQCGLTVQPDMDIEIENIRPEYGGRDILKRTAETDMLVYCFVHNPDPTRKIVSRFHVNPALQRDFTTSVHHHDKNVWHDSADRMRAKLLSVVIGELSTYREHYIPEINHRHFLNVVGGKFERLTNFEGHSSVTLMKRRDCCLKV